MRAIEDSAVNELSLDELENVTGGSLTTQIIDGVMSAVPVVNVVYGVGKALGYAVKPLV